LAVAAILAWIFFVFIFPDESQAISKPDAVAECRLFQKRRHMPHITARTRAYRSGEKSLIYHGDVRFPFQEDMSADLARDE
jgi:hypothetical protein